MVRVAIVGKVGSGKSRAAAALAAWAQAHGKRVAGFVAVAGDRPDPEKGATSYDLCNLASTERARFADRLAEGNPPYIFHTEALEASREWVQSSVNPDIVILDEFGPLEAKGEGHFPLLQELNVPLVVVTVRDSAFADLQDRLGNNFDVFVSASDPDVDQKLREVAFATDDWQRIGLYGAGAGAIEMSVGSVLHGLQVPVRGAVLSSTQAAVLTFGAEGLARRSRAVWIALIAAGLKALSPAGNRVRPMIAIASQGVLYCLGIGSLGWNFAGVALGGFLVGAWAAGQGLVLQYLFTGQGMMKAYDALVGFLYQKWHLTLPQLAVLAAIVILLYGSAALGASVWAFSRRRKVPERLGKILNAGPNLTQFEDQARTWPTVLRGVGRDLLRPSFWLPLLIIASIVLAADRSWNAALWIALRAITVAVVLFSLVRWFQPRKFVVWLRKRGHWGPAEAFERALRGPSQPHP